MIGRLSEAERRLILALIDDTLDRLGTQDPGSDDPAEARLRQYCGLVLRTKRAERLTRQAAETRAEM